MHAAKEHGPKFKAVKIEQITEYVGIALMVAVGLVMAVGLFTASGHVTW
jgi:hypothetical protein